MVEADISYPRPHTVRRRPQLVLPYYFLAPALLLIACITLVPILAGLRYSFLGLSLDNLFSEGRFLGFQNFRDVFVDPRLPSVIANTVFWTSTTLSLQTVLGVALALLLNADGVGIRVVQAAIFVTWALPSVLIGLVWKLLLDPTTSFLPGWLTSAGIIEAPSDFLADPQIAMWGPILAYVWAGIPFFAIITLAALKSIPEELYEAMSLDGASTVEQFWSITLPLIAPTLIVAMLLRSAWITNSGDLVWIITQGGPADATQILPTYLFTTAFVELNQGYAAALGVMQAAVLLAYAYLVLRLRQRFFGGAR